MPQQRRNRIRAPRAPRASTMRREMMKRLNVPVVRKGKVLRIQKGSR